MEIYERIKKMRTERGMSQQELADEVCLACRSTVCKIESGERKITEEMIVKFAAALGTTPVYLFTGETPIAKNVYHLPITSKIPLVGTIACGTPILAEQNITDYIQAPVKCDFCLTCKGDSMINARICDGDTVFIRQQEDVDNVEVAAVIIGDESTLKEYIRRCHNRQKGICG